MPSSTESQRRFMEMCSTPAGRAKARGKCPPLEVANEFVAADRAKARKGNPHAGKSRRGELRARMRS